MKPLPLRLVRPARSAGTGRHLTMAAVLACALAHTSTPAHAQSAQATAAQAAAAPSAPSAQPLRFSDFFVFPVGPLGLEISPTLKQAHGRTVQLTGYMVQQEHGSAPGQFFFTPRPVQMSEHADGDADDLPPATVRVRLAPQQADWIVPHAQGLIQLQGVLSVGRQEAADGRVTWVQLQLEPQATRSMSSVEWASHLHALQHRH